MRSDKANGWSTPCDHTPTTVVVMPTENGHRVRCLRCGEIGPEKENPGEAWVALRWWPRRERLERLRHA